MANKRRDDLRSVTTERATRLYALMTLGEAREVARGRSAAHRKLAQLIGSITGAGRSGRRSRR